MSAVPHGITHIHTLSHLFAHPPPLSVTLSLLKRLVVTHVIVGQSVDAFPPALLLGSQVQIRQDLPRGARAPLCVEGRKRESIKSEMPSAIRGNMHHHNHQSPHLSQKPI